MDLRFVEMDVGVPIANLRELDRINAPVGRRREIRLKIKGHPFGHVALEDQPRPADDKRLVHTHRTIAVVHGRRRPVRFVENAVDPKLRIAADTVLLKPLLRLRRILQRVQVVHRVQAAGMNELGGLPRNVRRIATRSRLAAFTSARTQRFHGRQPFLRRPKPIEQFLERRLVGRRLVDGGFLNQ